MRSQKAFTILCALFFTGAPAFSTFGQSPAIKPAVGVLSAPTGSFALDAVALKALAGRSIGPAIMGGRVSDIALDSQDPYAFYVGLATGGVMKTTDNGGTFQAIFEKEGVASIGAVAVAPSNPNVIWVGTGEANDRNSSAWGDGVYRSTDGGATWINTGLRDSKCIARIVIHPTDPNVAWVAAVGDLWRPNTERGLYKTVDGGKTWKAILQAPAPYATRVGCGDVAVDPNDPNIIYAAMYARQRSPWSFVAGADATDGKDVGGIFKSADGGATWKKLERGLPGRTGRIGLDVSRKDSRTVYAIVQSDDGGTSDIRDMSSPRGGVFRSDDKGETWTRVNPLNPRAFYFSQIRVDPTNDKRVYVLGFALHVSEDGGKSFREDFSEGVHADLHALAIDPRNPKRLVLGSDGGVYQSYRAGKGWEHLNRIAAGEYYRIAVDLSRPYRIAGGLQDNLNWLGPNMRPTKDGILNNDWINLSGGDGFYCVFDEDDPNILFAESQQGFVHRINLRNGEVKGLRPEPAEGQTGFRFHWNSPLIPSRHAKRTLYLAGNRVFKLTERGEFFKVISPDLSTQDVQKILTTGSGAENYGVVYTLAESPLKAGTLWAGTDDGKVWLTENDGQAWLDLTENLPASVKGQWISRIEASWHNPKVAYMAVDAHRGAGYAPLAYATEDGGKSWRSISSNLPANGPVKVIREDPKNSNVLYAGTEFGLYVSLDRGAIWTKFGELPTVAVDDLVVHPREMDLIVATHGRSLYVIDDVSPLQDLTPEVAAKTAHLFPPRPAHGFELLPDWKDSSGTAMFRGANPPFGAIFNVYVKSYAGEKIKIAVTDAAGKPVANLTGTGTPGVNRLVWDLRVTKDLLVEYGSEGAKFVAPGEYTATLTYGDIKQSQKFTVTIAEGLETR
jgi:photosystem II stability/assembly factor-like uncharacterized protein